MVNKTRQKGIIFLGLILIVVFVLGLALAWFYLGERPRDETNLNIGGTPAVNAPQKSKLEDLPELYPGVTWQESELISKDSNEYFLYVSDEPFSLNGQRWISRLSSEEFSEHKKIFENYYEDELTKRKWASEDLTLKGHKVTPMVAEGPIGSSWGYLALDIKSIREVVLSYVSLGETQNYELEIFVSDIYEIDDVLPK